MALPFLAPRRSGRPPTVQVSVAAPQSAPGYRSAAQHLGDAALLAGAVTVRVGGQSLLAVPAGPGRLGGFLPVDGVAADGVVGVLAGLGSRFAEVRLEPDGRGGVLVVWGVSCPPRLSEAARRRFYGAGGPGGGVLELRDGVLLDAVAHGSEVGALTGCRLAASEREVGERMAVVGEVLTGWRGLVWTAVVHEGVRRGVIPARAGRRVALGPAGVALLDAWAAGAPRDRLAALTGTLPGELSGLERAVCGRLGARSPEHAVVRAHEAGLLRCGAGAGPVRGP
ncbi:DUF6302 family protein [Streptomyces tsukubensis]|uniref:DUF6302 family protein n=1 Tax=Streptomyces tsukubensis TaxID=83656 RepID=UPI00345007DA